MELWWTCPNCGKKVNFTGELLGTCFNEDNGEAFFKQEQTAVFYFTLFSAPNAAPPGL